MENGGKGLDTPLEEALMYKRSMDIRLQSFQRYSPISVLGTSFHSKGARALASPPNWHLGSSSLSRKEWTIAQPPLTDRPNQANPDHRPSSPSLAAPPL